MKKINIKRKLAVTLTAALGVTKAGPGGAAPEALPRMMSACLEYSRNHRQTIGNFGAQRGLRPVRTKDGGIVLTYPNGARVHCAFDDWSRVTQVRMEQLGQA